MSSPGHNPGLPRSQVQKRKTAVGESFTMYRPLELESAQKLHDDLSEVQREGLLPDHAEIRPPGDMRVTYVERSKLTKNLKGFTAGFSAAEAISRINNECDSWDNRLIVSLGRVTMMDQRDESAVARLDHSQIIAEEFKLIANILTMLNVKGMHRHPFRPHVSLVKVAAATVDEKKFLSRELPYVIPEEVSLQPLTTWPKKPTRR